MLPGPQKCQVLILTAPFGLGHYTVSQAVKEQLIEMDSTLKIEIKDVLEFFPQPVTKPSVWIYNTLTKKYPTIYNYFYNKKNHEPSIKLNLGDTLYLPQIEKAKQYIDKKQPSLIISTFPTASAFISKIKKRYNYSVPLITVITDVVDGSEWLYEYTDMYFVPMTHIKERLMKKGLQDYQLKVTGVPVRKEFLIQQRPLVESQRILIMASVMDKLGLNDILLRELDKISTYACTIITGNNKQLYERLRKNKYDHIEVVGFSYDIPRYMEEALFIITKPGGVTVFESINKAVPMVVINSNIGQEKSNVEFIQQRNIGIIVENCNNLMEVISQVTEDPKILNNIKNNLLTIQKEIHPMKVGEYAFQLLGKTIQ